MNDRRTEKVQRAWTAVAVAALLLGGCGDGDDKAVDAGVGEQGTTTTPPAGAGAGAAAGEPGAQGGGAAGGSAGTGGGGGMPGGPAGGSAGAPGGTSGGPTTTRPFLPLDARFATPCLRPGTTQTITITTNPEVPVGFSSRYSDGKTGMDQGFHGGASAGKTDTAGSYTSTWPVAATAPAGPVTVSVFAHHPSYSMTKKDFEFKVSDAAGRCD